MFTATWVQTATYLFAVCPFSIAFLVFMNSSMSFVITDLIGLQEGEGDAAGTLGFADELLALVACPLWGIVSDRIGVRYVCCAGYAIIAMSFVLFVQARNVYPELLLGRLLFCLGGSAAATMVTAVLPSVTGPQTSSTPEPGSSDSPQSSLLHGRQLSTVVSVSSLTTTSSELTITPSMFRSEPVVNLSGEKPVSQGSPERVAGFVGSLTGCGALLALFVFLPLPARFEKVGLPPAEAIRRSYYLVASIALAVSGICSLGLRNLRADQGKGLRSLSRLFNSLDNGPRRRPRDPMHPEWEPFFQSWPVRLGESYMQQITAAFIAGFKHADIGLAYIGGFVARASSVGISLFIPLYVNQYYRSSGLCHEGSSSGGASAGPDSGLPDIKKSCPRAYIVASILTGVSQLIALVSAPAFGFLLGGAQPRLRHLPLLAAACSGIAGYILLAVVASPQIGHGHDNPAIFLDMALIGISQIGAIVCSLAILGTGILTAGGHQTPQATEQADGTNHAEGDSHYSHTDNNIDETSSLLQRKSTKPDDLSHLKGSIAGMYSLFGGAGILLLTKLGGLLFDKLSPSAPFCILAAFNGVFLVAGLAHTLRQGWKTTLKARTSSE